MRLQSFKSASAGADESRNEIAAAGSASRKRVSANRGGRLVLDSSYPDKSAKRVFAQMSRASTTFVAEDKEDVDGRVKPGHDGLNARRRSAHHLWISVPVP